MSHRKRIEQPIWQHLNRTDKSHVFGPATQSHRANSAAIRGRMVSRIFHCSLSLFRSRPQDRQHRSCFDWIGRCCRIGETLACQTPVPWRHDRGLSFGMDADTNNTYDHVLRRADANRVHRTLARTRPVATAPANREIHLLGAAW